MQRHVQSVNVQGKALSMRADRLEGMNMAEPLCKLHRPQSAMRPYIDRGPIPLAIGNCSPKLLDLVCPLAVNNLAATRHPMREMRFAVGKVNPLMLDQARISAKLLATSSTPMESMDSLQPSHGMRDPQ